MARGRDDDGDRLGFDETTNYLTEALGKFVPRWLARRALSVSVRTDGDRYDPDETVEITIEFENRLPVPITIYTPHQRLWGWTVDGKLAASDEEIYTRETPGAFSFQGGERKRITRTWDGRFKQSGSMDRWETAEPGEYEITAFVATDSTGHQPRDSTTITIDG